MIRFPKLAFFLCCSLYHILKNHHRMLSATPLNTLCTIKIPETFINILNLQTANCKCKTAEKVVIVSSTNQFQLCNLTLEVLILQSASHFQSTLYKSRTEPYKFHFQPLMLRHPPASPIPKFYLPDSIISFSPISH